MDTILLWTRKKLISGLKETLGPLGSLAKSSVSNLGKNFDSSFSLYKHFKCQMLDCGHTRREETSSCKPHSLIQDCSGLQQKLRSLDQEHWWQSDKGQGNTEGYKYTREAIRETVWETLETWTQLKMQRLTDTGKNTTLWQ